MAVRMRANVQRQANACFLLAHPTAFPAEAKNELTHEKMLALIQELPGNYASWGVVRQEREDEAYSDCSHGCAFAAWLEGALGADWCVCTNPSSHRVGLLTNEHQGCRAFGLEDDEALNSGRASVIPHPEVGGRVRSRRKKPSRRRASYEAMPRRVFFSPVSSEFRTTIPERVATTLGSKRATGSLSTFIAARWRCGGSRRPSSSTCGGRKGRCRRGRAKRTTRLTPGCSASRGSCAAAILLASDVCFLSSSCRLKRRGLRRGAVQLLARAQVAVKANHCTA